MAAFHNFPAGRLKDNHWGDALATFTTSARSPYHFSLHASDPADPDGRRDTGHTFICGPTGCGKTVLVGFLMAMLARREVTQILFDKGPGTEILVRALGGQYFPLRAGVSTGLNPLQLAGGPADLEFLKNWLRSLAGQSQRRDSAVRESVELDQALHATLALNHVSRRLSRLIEFLDPTDPRVCTPVGAVVPVAARETMPGFSTTPETQSSRSWLKAPPWVSMSRNFSTTRCYAHH